MKSMEPGMLIPISPVPLNLPELPPLQQLMYLACELYNSKDFCGEKLTDVILDYDWDNKIIYVYMMETDLTTASAEVFANAEVLVDFSQIGYIVEATKPCPCGEGGTTTMTCGKSSYNKKFTNNKKSNGSPPPQGRYENHGMGFYADRFTKHCVFCRKNGEPQSLYRTHVLRENNIITCPILRKYRCPVCDASGDNAHTLKHCPKNKGGSVVVGRHEVSRTGRNARGILGKTYRYD